MAYFSDFLIMIVILALVLIVIIAGYVLFSKSTPQSQDYLKHDGSKILDCYQGTMLQGKLPVSHEYCHEVMFTDRVKVEK